MHNALCDIYGMDVPIFAFSHSPAVIAAVSKSGGFGVLGAAGMEPEELDQALKYISQECIGKAFGIDLIIPDNYVGSEQGGLSLEINPLRVDGSQIEALDRQKDRSI